MRYSGAVPLEKLTRERIVEALNLLGEFAEQEQVHLELCIYGGSAMMLAYGARDSTKDVDVIAHPSDVAEALARRVAEQLDLHESWLNSDVRRFSSVQGTFAPLEVQGLEAAARRRLKITRASASYLLAMKCLAGRIPLPGYAGDIDDIRFLVKKMGLRSVEEVEEHLNRFYPNEGLTPRVREAIEGVLAEQRDES